MRKVEEPVLCVSSGKSYEKQFTGKEYDEDASLYYFNARWYDPETGRFTSLDPIRDGLNWYVYCSNNPVNAVDPTGLLSEDDDFPWNDLNYSRTTTPSSPLPPPTMPGKLQQKDGTWGNNNEFEFSEAVLRKIIEDYYNSLFEKLTWEAENWLLLNIINNENVLANIDYENISDYLLAGAGYEGESPWSYDEPIDVPEGFYFKPQTDVLRFMDYAINPIMSSRLRDVVVLPTLTTDENDRGYSLPGVIRINYNSSWQAGYNPEFGIPGKWSYPTEIGWVGYMTHEYWHQIQYNVYPLKYALIRLAAEQHYEASGGYSINNPRSVYYPGNTQIKNVLNRIYTFGDIPTLEGQAQFVGQWAADVYAWSIGKADHETMVRLIKEAEIVMRSEPWFKSVAAAEILLMYKYGERI